MIDNRLKVRQNKPTKEELAVWADIDKNIAKGDFVKTTLTSGGKQIIELCSSPIHKNTLSEIIFNDSFKPCFLSEYGFAISQRTRDTYLSLGVESVDTYTEDSILEFPITYIIYQWANVVRLQFATAPKIPIGTLCDIVGFEDSRFNFSNIRLSSIPTGDGLTFDFGYSNEAVIPTQAQYLQPSGSYANAKLVVRKKFASDYARYDFLGTNNTTAVLKARFNNGRENTYNTSFPNSPLSTIASTALVYNINVNNAGEIDLKPTSKFKLELDYKDIRFTDISTDAISQTRNPRGTLTEVKPNFNSRYRNALRMITPGSATTPIAKITAISKSGTTTTTITTDVAHGLTVNKWVLIKGVRDTTNFANTTTPVQVQSVISDTQFTIIHGSATTATSFGGIVCEGTVSDLQGVVVGTSNAPVIVQSASADISGLLTLTSNIAPINLYVGDYVELIGVRNSTSSLNIDGAYVVDGAMGTTMTFKQIKNLDGTLTQDGEGNNVSPNLSVFSDSTVGGTLIYRTTARLFDIMSMEYTPTIVKQDNEGVADISRATPVFFPATQNVNAGASQSTGATVSSTGGGGWIMNPAQAQIADVASAAITTTTTTSAIQNDKGNGFEIAITVTAVSGTSPTMDVSIEESVDGTNYYTLYDFERITATGAYKSPMLRATGKYIRYKQTITGTSPSFTRVINRNVQPMMNADKLARIIDRTISLTTANSVTPTLFVGSADNIALTAVVTSATTFPTLVIEGSEDGTNWIELTSTLTTIAGVARIKVNAENMLFARAKVKTAGATVVANYVSLKCW